MNVVDIAKLGAESDFMINRDVKRYEIRTNRETIDKLRVVKTVEDRFLNDVIVIPMSKSEQEWHKKLRGG